ncbi:SDR family oxidoreductase [Photorhabdus khanii]|uniref:SDR family oxidoreductase n=1 Tax=Photorhabdus khanii TaxID=1004150 RepID=A0A7C9GH03_9GAMM|nr:SDR family oxidoreductase [Photorhabdus khanii]MQL46716.1 SDR family oxidoreductase [Photorhabdus khanii]
MSENMVAVVGMACRFPGAENVEKFWELICGGGSQIKSFDVSEREYSRFAKSVAQEENWVSAGAALEDVSAFDAPFFGYSPKEAALMDPQLRLSLECAWHAFEDGNCRPGDFHGDIGVYLGVSLSTYLYNNLLSSNSAIEQHGGLSFLLRNDKDHVATTIAYKLGLTGPAMNVGSGCSSSLVAVHQAYMSLLTYQCDAALAGGASILLPQKLGYQYVDGGVYSKDGKCCPFAEGSSGTVGGNGVGLVLLKRLEDAVRDGDTIYSVIVGSGCSNDGNRKVGYTAPSKDGQVAAVDIAISMAQLTADQIDYVEAHGTGTKLGDPIEVAALSQVFNQTSCEKQRTFLGSVKANIGHLDVASGIAGFIKSVLITKHSEVPIQPNATTLNSQIDFTQTPFRVANRHHVLPSHRPLTAAVNSLGMGGTNAFLLLQSYREPKPVTRTGNKTWPTVFPLSAKDPLSLKNYCASLLEYISAGDLPEISDFAFSLANSKTAFKHRVVLHAGDYADLKRQLEMVTVQSFSLQPENASQLMLCLSGLEIGGISEVLDELRAGSSPLKDILQQQLTALGFSSFDSIDKALKANGAKARLKGALATYAALMGAVVEYLTNAHVAIVTLRGFGFSDFIVAYLAGVVSSTFLLQIIDEVADAKCEGHSTGDLSLMTLFDEIEFNRLMRASGRWQSLLGQLQLYGEFPATSLWWPSLATEAQHHSLMDLLQTHIAKNSILTLSSRQSKHFINVCCSCLLTPAEHQRVTTSETLVHILIHLWESGIDLDWQGLLPGYTARKVNLPGYCFSKNHYWISNVGEFKYSLQNSGGKISPTGLDALQQVEMGTRAFSAEQLGIWQGLGRQYIAALWMQMLQSCLLSESFSKAQLRELWAIGPRYEPVLEYCLSLLVVSGYLKQQADSFVVKKTHSEAELAAIRQQFEQAFPKQVKYIALIADLVAQYPAITMVDGVQSQLTQVLEKVQFADALESVSEYSEAYTLQSRRLAAFINGLAHELGRPLKIMEIGCGHLMLTKEVADSVEPGRLAHYCVTDVSPVFTHSAQSKAERLGLHYISTCLYDINLSPEEQGFVDREFDVIIGLNVFHLASNPRQSFNNLHNLLNKQGYLCQIDLLSADPSHNTVWGIYDQWWGPWHVGAKRTLWSQAEYGQFLADYAEHWHLVGDRQELTESSSVLWISKRVDCANIQPALAQDVAHLSRDNINRQEQWLGINDDPSQWLYSPQWQSIELTSTVAPSGRTSVVVYVDSRSAQQMLDASLSRMCDPLWLFMVDENNAYGQASTAELGPLADNEFILSGTEDLKRILRSAIQTDGSVSHVIYAVNIDQSLQNDGTANLTFDKACWIDRGLGGLFDLVQILDKLQPNNGYRLSLISKGLFNVVGNETLAPGHALSAGLLKSVSIEYPHVVTQHVDLPMEIGQNPPAPLQNILTSDFECAVALRGGRVWQQTYRLSNNTVCPAEPFDFNGAHIVVIGGLGGIGLAMTNYLTAHYQVDVCILHRNQHFQDGFVSSGLIVTDDAGLPEHHAGLLKNIASQARSLALYRVDITEQASVKKAVEEISCHYDGLDYVFHLAGSIDTGGILRSRTKSNLAQAIQNKTVGLHHTVQAFSKLRPKRQIFYSSLGAVLYKVKFGEAGYIIANDYLNAFARYLNFCGENTLCVNWTDWSESGMWVDAQQTFSDKYAQGRAVAGSQTGTDTFTLTADWMASIKTDDAMLALGQALVHETQEAVITPQDLNQLLSKQQSTNYTNYAEHIDRIGLRLETQQPSARTLSAEGEVQLKLSEIWTELLGLPLSSLEDDFYSVGGDSLLALRLIARVKETFLVELTLTKLMDTTTFGELADFIEDVRCLRGKPVSELAVDNFVTQEI